MAWNAYIALLGIWVLFVVPAVARKHGGRGWARGAAGLGLAGALYESWMTFVWGPTVVNPIRIDIFLVFPLLTAVYLLASWSLFRAAWRRTGLAAGALTLAAAGAMGITMGQIRRDTARHDALRAEGNRLLFAAKFSDQQAYDAYFGFPGDATSALPFGHWTSEEALRFTRLVVGGDGRAYLFFGCGDSECQFGSGEPLEGRGDGFAAELTWRGVGRRALELDPPEGETLELRVDAKPHRLRRTPPPLLQLPREERLAYLGTFSATDPLRQHARVSQLWLWRGEEGLYAVGIFRILVAGRRADFVVPLVLGRGTPDGEAWRFTWTEQDGTGEARVQVGTGAVDVELTRLGRRDPWPPQRLAPGALFRDDAIELASRSSAADWQHWMDTLLDSHFSSGDIPAN